jgi:hypothetical protein
MNVTEENAEIFYRLVDGCITNINKKLCADFRLDCEPNSLPFVRSDIKKSHYTINCDSFKIKTLADKLTKIWNYQDGRICMIWQDDAKISCACVGCDNLTCILCITRIIQSNNYCYKCPYCRKEMNKVDSISALTSILTNNLQFTDNDKQKKLINDLNNLKIYVNS